MTSAAKEASAATECRGAWKSLERDNAGAGPWFPIEMKPRVDETVAFVNKAFAGRIEHCVET